MTVARGAAILVVLLVSGTGCAVPAADTSACADAPADVVVALQGRVEGPGALRFAQTVASPESSLTFVSAELHRPEDDEDEDGEVLTWSAAGDGAFEAVDSRARAHSSWPEAAADVRTAGAVESRACVSEARAGDQDADGERREDGGSSTGGRCPVGTPASVCEGRR